MVILEISWPIAPNQELLFLHSCKSSFNLLRIHGRQFCESQAKLPPLTQNSVF